jgi:LCP family protein required for cell wall assembly
MGDQPDRTALYPPGSLGHYGPGEDPHLRRMHPSQSPDRQQAVWPPIRSRPPAGYQPLLPAQERTRRTPGVIVGGRIIAGVLSVAVLATVAFASIFLKSADDKIQKGPSAAAAGESGVLFRGGTNIMLIGSDARTDQQGNPLTAAELALVSTQADGGGVNTDTIMVVHIPQGGGKATAISLPRDTWIPQSVTDEVQGPYSDGTRGPYKPNKINSFYSTAKTYTAAYDVTKGGMTAAQREVNSDNAGRTELQAIVQAFTGLRIDHYAEVNLIGFYTLSNAIGGVPVCLNEAVDDPFSGANFKAGPQEIQGSAAMSFVRQRHGLPGGDLDRVRRQQAFLAGATSKMLSAGVLTSPSKMSSLLDAAAKAVVLDSGFDLTSFAEQMSSLSGGNVKFETMPTTGASTASGTDALATDPAQIKAFFKAIDGSSGDAAPTTATSGRSSATTAAAGVAPSSVTVDVQNATKVNNLAASVSATLVAAGYQAGDVTTFPGVTSANQHATTTISYPAGAKTAATAVQKALGGRGKLVQDDSIGRGHVSVAAGRDMPAPSGLRAMGAAGVAAASSGSGDSVGIAVGAVAAPATSSGPAPITAANVGCVN